MGTTAHEQDLVTRLAVLEGRVARLAALEARVARLEARVLPVPPLPAPPAPPPRPAPPPAPPRPAAGHATAIGGSGDAAAAVGGPGPGSAAPPGQAAAASPWSRLRAVEDLLGGRVLAWVGGSAVVLAILFLLSLALERGWFGPTARVLTAATVSAALVALGTWLQEGRARTQAALWTTGAGVTGLLLTLLAAAPGYGLLPVVVALPAAAAVGVLSVGLGLRWSARALIWLGVWGAVGAPASLAGSAAPLADPLWLSLSYLVVVAAAAAALCVARRWDGLLLATLLLTWAPVAWWTTDEPAAAAVLAVVPVVGAVSLTAAVTALRRSRAPRQATTPLLLAAVSAWWLAEAGTAALPAAADRWWQALVVLVVLGVAGGLAAHGTTRRLLAGLLAQRAPLVTPVSGLLVLLVGALGAPGAGPGWATVASLAWRSAAVVGFDLLARRAGRDHGDTTAVDAASLTLLAAVSWGLVDGWLRLALLCLAVVVLRGVARAGGQRTAEVGALALWGVGVLHVALTTVPLRALFDGVGSPGGAAAALLALAAVAGTCALLTARAQRTWTTAAAAALGYLVSALVVTAVLAAPPHWPLGAGTRQGAQVALGALWTISGAVALWAGLRRDRLTWRIAGFVLFGLAVVKAVLYDLALLELGYRAASYFALGLLLLAGAHAYQRRRARAG